MNISIKIIKLYIKSLPISNIKVPPAWNIFISQIYILLNKSHIIYDGARRPKIMIWSRNAF